VLNGDDLKEVKPCHIRKQQRNGRQCLTLIEGLDPDMDLKKVIKVLKKTLHCNGVLKKDAEGSPIVCLSGDHRHAVADQLLKWKVLENRDRIMIHGE